MGGGGDRERGLISSPREGSLFETRGLKERIRYIHLNYQIWALMINRNIFYKA